MGCSEYENHNQYSTAAPKSQEVPEAPGKRAFLVVCPVAKGRTNEPAHGLPRRRVSSVVFPLWDALTIETAAAVL